MINNIPNCRASKRIANLIKSGEPDVTGIINRIRLEIEYKVPGKNPTELQARELKKWDSLGAVSGVSHSILETIQILSTNLTKEQKIAVQKYLEEKKRSILLREQILDANLYIKTFWL
jgi:hypothetical protein